MRQQKFRVRRANHINYSNYDPRKPWVIANTTLEQAIDLNWPPNSTYVNNKGEIVSWRDLPFDTCQLHFRTRQEARDMLRAVKKELENV